MVYSVFYSPNFTPISSSISTRNPPISSSSSTRNPIYNNTYLNRQTYNKRKFCVQSVASSSIPYHPINRDYLQKEFSGHGITFQDIGENCIAKLALDNGSTANVVLPSGVITSYKVPVWHGGKVELLHTAVSEDGHGGAVIRGGVSPAFGSDQCNSGKSWSETNWVLQDIEGNSMDSVRVELASSDADNMVEMKYIITLKLETLSSELIVSNTDSSPIQLKGSITSHLTVSTPDATYAVGLEGSSFIETTPFLTRFSIVPDEEEENESGFVQFFNQIVPEGIFPGFRGFGRREKEEEKVECEEKSNYKQLNKEMSRIYTSAPRNFTVIDRGRRNSVVVRREGFEEVYVSSPGSRHDCYDKFSYVCIGQSALLKPIVLKPGDVWRGAQHLHNPNL